MFRITLSVRLLNRVVSLENDTAPIEKIDGSKTLRNVPMLITLGK